MAASFFGIPVGVATGSNQCPPIRYLAETESVDANSKRNFSGTSHPSFGIGRVLRAWRKISVALDIAHDRNPGSGGRSQTDLCGLTSAANGDACRRSPSRHGEVYRVGGAQGITALAFGTESIPR